MFLISAPLRKPDPFGEGHYGASRGSRTHNGIDLCALPGSYVYPVLEGTVTKIGYPYKDDLSFRYVEIDVGNFFHRYFYVEPLCAVGDILEPPDYMGFVQDLTTRYPGITNHFHFEIKNPLGDYIDPTGFLT